MMKKDRRQKQGECKTLSKVDCQLTEFPTVRLHILQKVEEINLSHNRICDFGGLRPHMRTSQLVLK